MNEMPRKEFTEILDSIWKGEPIKGDPGIMEKMSEIQKIVWKEHLRTYKRNK